MAVTYEQVPAVLLVEDLSLYPRLQVDDHHVARLAEALRAGASLPPVVADRATKRIVDGFHRRRAALRVFGETATIAVEFHDYADEAAIVLDAIRRNAAHGKRLSTAEEVRCLLIAERVGIDRAAVAAALAVRVERLEELAQKRVADGPTERVVLKPAMAHLAGKRVDAEQERVNRHLNGNQASYYARMLIELLESDAIDWSNRTLVERLERLYELLAERLCARAA